MSDFFYRLNVKVTIYKNKFFRFIFLHILSVLPVKRNIILFESYPEMDGSPWMIYREIKKRFGKKYMLVWAVDKSFVNHTDIKSVPFFGKISIIQKIVSVYYLSKAKLIVDSNRPVYKYNPYSIRIFTRHGGPLKKCSGYMHSLGKMDYILSLSNLLQDIDYQDCKGFCLKDKENVLTLGFPANDRLFDSVDLYLNGFYPKLCSLKAQFRFKKIIGWLPTFRQHYKGHRNDSDSFFPFGLPLIKEEKELVNLNKILKDNEVLLAIQMHHAQMSIFSQKSFSNIVLIHQDLKYEMNVSTANLMNSFDALITDYSAAYHEYILLDRPIALSIDDYESYASKTGFVFDYFDWIKGVYLKTTDDLVKFVEDVANGVDAAKDEREKAMHRIHKYVDNNSTQRVVDFLVEKAKL